MTEQEKEFFSGAFLMLAEVYRAHGCSVTVKDCIKIIPDFNEVARKSSEFDVRDLRNVINTLPMGCDADYEEFWISATDESCEVQALLNNELHTISIFDDIYQAQTMMDTWRKQVKENQSISA